MAFTQSERGTLTAAVPLAAATFGPSARATISGLVPSSGSPPGITPNIYDSGDGSAWTDVTGDVWFTNGVTWVQL